MTLSVNMLCFTASYGVALALEIMGVWARPRWRRLAETIAAVAGIVAHTWYLAQRAAQAPWAPLSSPHDWYLAGAWALAVIYVLLVLYQPRASIGLFLLPVTLGLIAAARSASAEPLASFDRAKDWPLGMLDPGRFWGLIHGVFLMLGTVAVLLGFVAGVMYLVQSHRLKYKLPTQSNFRLPSLEWLERLNSRSLTAALPLVAFGFFTGILTRLATVDGEVPWTDPVVLSLSGMLSWLVASESFRLAYPPARRGRKVAYLTLAGFVFLLITLATFLRHDGVHGKSEDREARGEGVAKMNVPAPSPWRGGLGRGVNRVHGLSSPGHAVYPLHHPSLVVRTDYRLRSGPYGARARWPLPLKGRGPEDLLPEAYSAICPSPGGRS